LHAATATAPQPITFSTDVDFQEFAMRGSTVDQLRKDIDPSAPTEDVSGSFSEQIRVAEMAAGLQPLSPPHREADDVDGALWFVVGVGISAAIIGIAAAVT
jgi:hypothetical protein